MRGLRGDPPRKLPKRDDRLLAVGKVQPDLYEDKLLGLIFPMFSQCGVQIGRSTSLLTTMISNSPLIFINGSHVFGPRNRAELQIPVFRHRKPNTKEISKWNKSSLSPVIAVID